MAQRPDIPDDPLLVEQATDVSGGVHDVGATHLIPFNKTSLLTNIETTFDGQRQKRLGVLARGTPGGASNPNGAFAFEDKLEGLHHIVVQQANALFSNDGATLNFTPRATTFSLYDTQHHAVQGQGATGSANLFIATSVPYSANTSLPTDHLLAIDQSWGATLITDVRPRALAWYQKRLWAFNSSATRHGQDYLAWSNVLDGRNWSNGQTLEIDPEGGDPGTALIPLRGDSARMLCFKERSVHLLDIFWDTDGAYPSAANTLDFTGGAFLRPIVSQTGCIATRGLTWAPGLQGGDILFLSREGIRSLNRSATDAQGGAGLPLSWTIQKTIDRINWAKADQAVATFWDNIAYFAVPVDGSEINNFVIAYNTLRPGFYFLDWDVNEWVTAELDAERKFFFFGGTAGSDGQSTYTLGNHLFETDTGLFDPHQSPITMEEQTRGFVFSETDDPGEGILRRKIWRRLEIRARGAATTATLSISFKVDDQDEWTNFEDFSFDPTDSFPILPVPLPFTFSSGRIVRKNFSLHDIPIGHKLQFRFRDTTSFGRIDILELNVRATRLQETFS